MNKRPTIVVVGSGISGLTAAYILRQKYDVTLYEAAERLGGHTNTHIVTDSNGTTHPVDSGFIIHNRHTYPMFIKLLKELGIATRQTKMGLSVSCRGCGLEFAGGDSALRGLFASPLSLVKPDFLKLIFSIKRFNKEASEFIQTSGNEDITLGEFIEKGSYSPYFETHYVLPIVSSIWSCEFDLARNYPAKYLFQFFKNHGMLDLGKPGGIKWRVIPGGSSTYIGKITPLLHRVVKDSAVVKLERIAGKIVITDSTGSTSRYDKAVVATHPDQALRLLAKPTRKEKKTLGAFRYTNTTTQLHTDTSVLSRRKNTVASWNYLIPNCSNKGNSVYISYDMSRVQHIEAPERYIVSFDGPEYVDQEKVITTMHYQHPLFTLESVAAQADLPALNTSQLAFAGAYHGWGFHEDGCRSGVAAASALGVRW